MNELTINSLTHDQQLAIKKMTMWYNLIDNQQYYRLVGYAGTGKTFIINFLIKELGLDSETQVAFCAFTGSAAMNLVKKGNKNATTIHQLIYETSIIEKPVYKKVKNKETGEYENTTEILRYEKHFLTTKKIYLNPSIKLIVIDEFSMASDDMLKDVLSFGVKVLLCGDPGQLPSIQKVNTFINDYDSILEEIVRQKGESSIIDLSFKAREKIAIPYGTYNDDAEILPMSYLDYPEDALELYAWADQIICGTNKTRKRINNVLRKHLGYTDKLPQVGDKIVCTQNNWKLVAYSPKLGTYIALVNGTMGYVTKIKAISTVSKEFIIDFKTDFDNECIFEDVKVSFYNFDDEVNNPPSNNGKFGREITNVFDFGYCMTVHKAQGNGYGKVLVIAEKMTFGKSFDIETERRWLYTAITRAEKQLIMLIDEKYYRSPLYERSKEFWKSYDEYY